MLVATDVAARGIDVEDITHVINYQLPDEIEIYTHRSGRTGRAGKTGVSMVIVTKSDLRKIKAIEKKIQKQFDHKEIPSGMEICEIQLHHLANSIKETEINHEIDSYLPTINEIFEDLSKEELIKKMFSVEFTRFYNYYKKGKDINIATADLEDDHKDSVRFFVNVGSKDDFNWMRLKDFLRDLLQVGKDDIFKVDVMGSFSFFNTESKHQQLVLDTFHDFSLDGRRISVEISKDTGRNRGGRNKNYKKRGSSGNKYGRKTNSDRPKFKGKDRSRSSKPESRGTGGKRRNRK
jgi:ATP-dependent RNA helicase DeaD